MPPPPQQQSFPQPAASSSSPSSFPGGGGGASSAAAAITVFGELELRQVKSIGHTPLSPPAPIGPTTIAYVSGNSINFLDISKLKQRLTGVGGGDDGDDGGDAVSPLKPIVVPSQVSAFATLPRESVLAYSERGATRVAVVKWPGGASALPAGVSALQADPYDTTLLSLAFSFDGKYLVALGGIPSFRITLWDWKSNTPLLTSAPNECPACFISFNPANSRQFCTSGGGGDIKFWKVDVRYRSCGLKAVEGSTFTPLDPISAEPPALASILERLLSVDLSADPSKSHALNAAVDSLASLSSTSSSYSSLDAPIDFTSSLLLTPLAHAWMPNNAVVNTWETGDLVTVYSTSDKTRRILSDDEGAGKKCVAVGKDFLALGGEDGVLRYVRLNGEMLQETPISPGDAIVSLAFMPDYKEIVITTRTKSIFLASAIAPSATAVAPFGLVLRVHASKIAGLALFRVDNTLAIARENGCIDICDAELTRILYSWKLPSDTTPITAVAASPFAPVLAVATAAGVVRIFDTAGVGIGAGQPKLVWRDRLFDGAVKRLLFDPTGHYLAVQLDGNSHVCLLQLRDKPALLGYIAAHAAIMSIKWDLEVIDEDSTVDEASAVKLALFTLTHDLGKTFFSRYNVPIDHSIKPNSLDPLALSETLFPAISYRVSEIVDDFCPIPTDVAAASESFLALCSDKKLKIFGVQSSRNYDEATNSVLFGSPLVEYHEHEKPNGTLHLSLSRDWLLSRCPDGRVTVRSLLEPDKPAVLSAHDPFHGGARHVAASRDTRFIYTAGDADGLLRVYEWRSVLSSNRRAWTEATATADALVAAQDQIVAADVAALAAIEDHADVGDPPDEVCALRRRGGNVVVESKSEDEVGTSDAIKVEIFEKIESIRNRIVETMERNETIPQLEQLQKDDFVLDFAESDRLNGEADATVHSVKTSIEEENMKKRVLRNRIKKECWDSMDVIGQSIKSFRPDPVTAKTIEVQNYSIRKRESADLDLISKIQVLRRSQMIVAENRKQQKKSLTAEVAVADEPVESPMIAETPVLPPPPPEAPSGTKHLLYENSELITHERRRMQILLLSEVSHETKVEFNSKFKDFVKIKKEEMAKIEEKNDRIQTILGELQIQEAMFHPALDDDEVPERIIEVLDSEVKVEKFISAEERKRLEEKRLQEEERLRAQQSDNSRERALMMMMGGKLEDRTEENEKEELVRPEWMNKPKEEMSEEERKLLKEFEKKMATFKEEQEKYRKALETELRKLQGTIQEICDAFDQKLKDLFEAKLKTDQTIYQNELNVIKLLRSSLLGEGDEPRELQLNTLLDDLKSEKTKCAAETPELKKEVERAREEYDAAVKRDKEIERQFKKEFSANDSIFETMYRLFKRRQPEKAPRSDDTNPAVDSAVLSPFEMVEKTLASAQDDTPIPALSYDLDVVAAAAAAGTDATAALPVDLFHQLCEHRDRKIAAEADMRRAAHRLSEVQGLLQAVSDDHDRIKRDADRAARDLAAFAEYRLQAMHNLDGLFQLKQGQVEVPQAPVVTDYSDAALIHRTVVERLNDSIVALGQAKVEALKEMKEYRKGIHALEWENKMLDFQAEDLVIRTRDIQLLRVTKQMQEYIRGGDERKQTTEVAALEKRAEYSQKAHGHKIDERRKTVTKYQRKIRDSEAANSVLAAQLADLERDVADRARIHEVQAKKHGGAPGHPGAPQPSSSSGGGAGSAALREIVTRRRLVDLAKSQAQDIAILREEVERLRLRTYPAFPARAAAAAAAPTGGAHVVLPGVPMAAGAAGAGQGAGVRTA
ncbi:hypothetical protein DFJ73DRAFT_800748 [Zopfochytrium polystomum]|nr:hypothetical protein DFJ73DRAFT_800748 [Zopfochytrium polystomum]